MTFVTDRGGEHRPERRLWINPKQAVTLEQQGSFFNVRFSDGQEALISKEDVLKIWHHLNKQLQ